MKRYKRKSLRTGQYKSKLESVVAKRLGAKAIYESARLSYVLPPKVYIPDFIVTRTNGQQYYLEVKGYHRYEDQVKMRAVKECHPALDIRMFFPKDNKVQGTKLLNSEWCIKYNFPCAIEKIPRSWT